MRASFWLEAAHSPDTGLGSGLNANNQSSGQVSSPAGTQGLTFGRRSTVSLAGTSSGEIRLSRDYVPSFNNLTVSMHPFGTNGVGNAGQLFYPLAANGTTARTSVRASNSLGYILPSNLNGYTGHVMYAMGENASDLGYVHDLSKRTALFTNYSKVSNLGTGKQFTVGSGNSVTTAGGSSTGYEFGVGHIF